MARGTQQCKILHHPLTRTTFFLLLAHCMYTTVREEELSPLDFLRTRDTRSEALHTRLPCLLVARITTHSLTHSLTH